MSVRVMIIDGEAAFRTLLMHHVTTCWDDAIISAYDPVSAGNLPEEFSGAGNDIILLGSEQGGREPLQTVRQFKRVAGFPPLVFFGEANLEEKRELERLGVEASFPRDKIQHDLLSVRLAQILRSRRRLTSTDSLFVGDLRGGFRPLIKGYRMIRKLSVGEYSVVYLAERLAIGKPVVLKVLRQVPDFAEGLGAFDRFLQEYELIAGIEHPGIVKIHDLGVADDHAHIAMEYMPGGNLKSRIAGGIAELDAVDYVKQIASALSELHGHGILHRDLKPGNIMFRDDGSLAIIDFGLAKQMRLNAEMTGSGEIFGTPYYMSPEQGHAEEVDERSDVYSLGVMFFEMLAGEKPFKADSAMGIIYKHTHAPIPLLPASMSRYQPVMNRMLAKRPEDRLQTVADIEACL